MAFSVSTLAVLSSSTAVLTALKSLVCLSTSAFSDSSCSSISSILGSSRMVFLVFPDLNFGESLLSCLSLISNFS